MCLFLMVCLVVADLFGFLLVVVCFRMFVVCWLLLMICYVVGVLVFAVCLFCVWCGFVFVVGLFSFICIYLGGVLLYFVVGLLF